VQIGIPGFDLGACSDVMTGVPKADATLMLLRAMNPQVVAVDEISAPEDAEALVRVSNCGVTLLATIHAFDISELREKPFFPHLRGLFKYLVTIRRENERRSYITEEFPV
jgi:stage III sporulation protein AA